MRKGKPIVRKRAQATANTPTGLALGDAFDFFVLLKKTEGVRERTQQDYRTLYGYFTEWLADNYPEVMLIDELSTGLLREYIV